MCAPTTGLKPRGQPRAQQGATGRPCLLLLRRGAGLALVLPVVQLLGGHGIKGQLRLVGVAHQQVLACAVGGGGGGWQVAGGGSAQGGA